MNKIIPINFGWKFKADFCDDYLYEENFKDFQNIDIPHTVKILPINYINISDFQKVSTYCYKLDKIALSSNEIALLRFEGVANYCEIYCNAHLAGSHKGAYTSFEIDISPYLNNDCNFITIKVDSTERKDIPPFGGVIDYLVYGGIYREVSLIIASKSRIKNYFITSDIDTNKFHFEIELTEIIPNGIIDITVSDSYNIFKSCEKADKIIIEAEILINDYIIWNIDNPFLYDVSIIYKAENILDTKTCKTGFRKINFTSDGFYLNGIKLKLLGLNRHQSYAYIGYAATKRLQESDAVFLKNFLGVNCVRTSHYPQSIHFLNKCDEIGLLVLEEIPGWQHIGDDSWQELSIKNVQDMIERDYNHPSIIMWGIRINESIDNDVFYTKTNNLAHSLDSSRPTFGVRYLAKSNPIEDVYTYNDFIHRGNNEALNNPDNITSNTIPYMITEHNGHMYPTKSFDAASKCLEHSLRHTRVIDKMMSSNRIGGCIGWCMSDYNTHYDFGSGDGVCYHGISDIFRRPKLAAYVYASQYNKNIILEVSTDMNTGDYDAGEIGNIYAFTNCDFVRLYKNNEFVRDFYPISSPFKSMPHPPIVIDDLIGTLIEKNEQFSVRDAKIVKNILLSIIRKGWKLTVFEKLKMFFVMKKYKMSMQKATELYGKYIGNWGKENIEYKFQGFINDKCVAEKITNKIYKPTFKVEFDSKSLIEKDTYDMTGIYVTALDEYGNKLHYANNIVTLSVDDSLEILCDSSMAMRGGVAGFYVKTTGKGDQTKISLTVQNIGSFSDIIEINNSNSQRTKSN